MLTNREQMIFNWIKEQPSITQKEIAERAGISRSSVSVHISNLTAKGAILGRRYILSERPYIIVIGAANMDIAGRPDSSLVAGDSNPGKVTMSFGGVGRNIAHNLALLDGDVRLLTAFGEDYRARELKEGCLDCGIDIDASITVPGASTSTYLFIMDEQGEMQEAINDMQIYEYVTPERIEERLDIIQHAAACVIDTNLPQQTIEFIAKNVTCPIFCDPVSSIKAQKLKKVLGKIHTLKPNHLEAEALSGIKITDNASLEAAAHELLATGLKRIFISLGEKGLFCADHEKTILLPLLPAKLVNMTGAGDAIMAGVTWAYTQGMTLEQTGLVGLAASTMAVEGENTINEQLNVEEVIKRAGI